MANFQVDRYGLAGTDQSLPLKEETYGTVGPVEKKWVKKHVYWVLPLGTVLIVVLILFAVDAFDRPEKIVMVPIPTPTASSHIRGSSTTEGPIEMTVGTVKSALAETEQIINSANKIAEKMKPAVSTNLQTPKTEKAESPSPQAPPVRIWDSPTNR